MRTSSKKWHSRVHRARCCNSGRAASAAGGWSVPLRSSAMCRRCAITWRRCVVTSSPTSVTSSRRRSARSALLAETMAARPEGHAVSSPDQSCRSRPSSHIVDDLLDLSLIEAQEDAGATLPVPLLDREAVELRRPSASRQVPIRSPGPRGELRPPPVVKRLINLLDNASSTPARSATRRGSVRIAGDGDQLVVACATRHRDPDSRSRTHLRALLPRRPGAQPATGGTGLGLSIVRHVAQAHGGDVTVESREGEGSIFRLRIRVPIRTLNGAARRREASDAEPPHDPRRRRRAVVPRCVVVAFSPKASSSSRRRRCGSDRALRRDAARARAARRDAAEDLGHRRVPRDPVAFARADHHGDRPQLRDRRRGGPRGRCRRLRDEAVPAARGWWRVRVRLSRSARRRDDDPDRPDVLEIGDVRLDAAATRSSCAAPRWRCRSRSSSCSSCCWRTRTVLTRDVLIDRIWGPNYFGDTKTLDVHVKRLRARSKTIPRTPTGS